MILYIFISCLLTGYIGQFLYTQGKAWSSFLVPDQSLSDKLNLILLTLFYLLNIGFIFLSVFIWEHELAGLDLATYITKRVAIIIALIGFLHIQNTLLFLIFFYFKIHLKWKL